MLLCSISMKHCFIYLLGFVVCHCYLNSTRTIKSDENDLTNLELEMIKDMFQYPGGIKNLIILTSNWEIVCPAHTCEIYARYDIVDRLYDRGRLYDPDIDDILDPHPLLEKFRIKNAASRENDVFILKLVRLHPEDINLLNVIREYNKKSFMVIFVDEEIFTNVKKHILEIKLFNTYLVKKASALQMYFVYEFCAFCAKGQHQLKYFNRWEKDIGFIKRFQFVSSFKGQFYGADFKAGLKMAYPHHFVIGIAENSLPIYGGQDYWPLEYIAKSSNFNIMMVPPSDDKLCYYRMLNEGPSFSGGCKMLRNGEVDFAGFPDELTYWNYQFFDYIGVYHIITNRLVSAKVLHISLWLENPKVLK